MQINEKEMNLEDVEKELSLTKVWISVLLIKDFILSSFF